MQVQTAVIQSIPLKLLHASDRNVRRVPKPVDDLIASIRAHGMQHNLVVWPHEDGHGYEVIAGERRRRALLALQEAGELTEDDLVDCRVLPLDASPEEISLAENVGREGMHPVDELAAYKHLIDSDGSSVADIAVRFGRSERYVTQRLKLANLAPDILEDLRTGVASLAQAMALALTDDHTEQLRVWKAAKKTGYDYQLDPKQLRAALTQTEISVKDSRIGRFLGAADYEKGGGVPRRDLFGSDDDAWLPDSKLAKKLANEKLQKAVGKLKEEGWLWVEGRLDFDHSALSKFSKYGARDKYSHVDTTKVEWPSTAKKVAGAVVTIGHNGKPEIHRGLIRPEDAKRIAAEAKKVTKGKGKATDTPLKPKKKPGELSFAQIQRLQGHRTAALRLELARNPRVALAAFAADLAQQELFGRAAGRTCDVTAIVHIAGDRHVANQNIRVGLGEHPAAAQLDKLEADWLKRLKPAKADLFAWLLKQPEAVTHELRGFLASQAIIAGDNFAARQDRGAQFAATAGVDMVKHWTPSKDWLASQPTGVILAAVTECCGKAAATEVDRLKGKEAKAARAAQLMDGKGWLPKPLRTLAPKKAKG